MNLRTVLAVEDAKAEERKQRAARREFVANNGNGSAPLTPSQWFSAQYPKLADQFGEAVLEETNKSRIVVKDLNEDYLAGTMGNNGNPKAPTVYIPPEGKFFRYSPEEGIYTLVRESVLIAEWSQCLLACARATRSAVCDTKGLEFRLRDTTNLHGVLRKARGLLEVPDDFFSTDLTNFIPCNNGMLRISDNAVLPFDSSYRRRNKLAVTFDPSATCPIFLDTLMRPALEPDDLELLQRWCGLALVGENISQKILMLIGNAGTGKGCFIRILSGVIGQINLASLRPQLLGERFELGRFLGKSLLYGADVPENFLNQRGASILKSLTGADPMTLEFKNSNEAPSIVCKFNVAVTCNSRLTVHLEGDTDAWRRRLLLIDYHKDKPKKVIADLDELILTNEGSGVLNWMLEGLAKLRADGWQLHLNKAQQERVDNLLLESDALSIFIKTELVRAEESLTVPDSFTAFAEFCTQRGWTTLSRNRFGQQIGDGVTRTHGLTIRHDIPDASGKHQRGWSGLSLRGEHSKPSVLADEIIIAMPKKPPVTVRPLIVTSRPRTWIAGWRASAALIVALPCPSMVRR
jgi:P4 family phage/plasmid primase-like protien